MRTPLEVIAEFGVSTTSCIRAIQDINDPDRPITLSKAQYEQTIADIIGGDHPPVYRNEKEARIYFLYVVQETIRAFQTDIPEMDEVWEEAQRRAADLIQRQPWVAKDYKTDEIGEPKLDATGNPKKRKGAKKEEAEALYRKMNDGLNDRPTIVAALMEEVGLSKPGATTYFHNLKKQFGFSGPDTPKRKVKPAAKPPENTTREAIKKAVKASKKSIARQVYDELKGQSKDDILTGIIERAGTTKAGANTYYCSFVNDDTRPDDDVDINTG